VITDAVVPVAGLGTRLLPATRSQPKEMLPLVDKPVVQYVVEELAAAGIERILFVTGRRKRAIEDHFEGDPALGPKIFYTRQPDPRGLGDAVARAGAFVTARGAVVALGDSIITRGSGPGIVTRMIEAFQDSGASAAVAVAPVADELVSRYGIVVPVAGADPQAPFEVAGLLEKPEPGEVPPSRMAIMGRYVLGPAVFDALTHTPADAAGEVQLTDALARAGRVVAVPLVPGERRHDIGTVESYCAAFLEYALRHPQVGPTLRARASALLDHADG
jgi:UTP--glucose-1-phosphate uridylyltransferase